MLHVTIFFSFVRVGYYIGILFWKMLPVTAIMDAISLLFSAMDNALLHAYRLSPEDKTEE